MGFLNLFSIKKKKTKEKRDYQDFIIKINMKTILLFEEMADKSFYDMTDDDIILLIYCSVVINNDITLSYTQFKFIMKNERIASELFNKCKAEIDFIQQFEKEKVDEKDKPTENERLSDLIIILTLQYGLDINYVMNEMRLWELGPMAKGIDMKSKADMTEKRFWNYLTICPHIDSKKIKSPEDMLPFPWEKEEKKEKHMKELENNKFAMKNMIGKNIFGKDE